MDTTMQIADLGKEIYFLGWLDRGMRALSRGRAFSRMAWSVMTSPSGETNSAR